MKIRYALSVVMVAGLLPMTAMELARETLSKSGPLVLSQTDGVEKVVYELSIPGPNGVDRIFWKRELPLVQNGRAPEGCRLRACDERDGTIAVMLGLNYFTMMLVQYEPATGKMQEHRINGGEFLTKIDRITGDFKVVAPDQLVLGERDGTSKSFFLRDGYIVDEEGVRTDPPVGGSSRKSNSAAMEDKVVSAAGKKPTSGLDGTAPVVADNENEGKKIWILIFVAGGAVIFLLLSRKFQNGR